MHVKKTWFILALMAILTLWIILLANQVRVINVKDYGAAGDGVTDDTKAIQRALQHAPNHTIYFPPGVYAITEELPIHSGTEIEGNDAIIQASSGLLTILHIKGDNVRVTGLTINGNRSSLRGITIAEGSHNVDISDCIIKNFTQPKNQEWSRMTVSGIRIAGDTKNISIDHSAIQNVTARNPVKGWGHLIARGILISPLNKQQAETNNITISGSSFTNIGPKDDGDGIVVQGFKNHVQLKIINNTFSANHKRAIKIQSPGVLVKGNTITNNFYKNNFYTTYQETKTYDMWAAISVYADDTIIEQNTITGVGRFARIIDIANASSIKVIDNVLKNGYIGTDKLSPIISITSSQTGQILKNFTILDNTFINGRYGVLAASKITNLKVWNNKLLNS